MDQYMIFVAGLIVGMIVMSIIVIACNLDNSEEESKVQSNLDYLAAEGIIYLDPLEEIVRVDENKYMIKIKGRR